MDLKNCNAIKGITKRSAGVCSMYLVLCLAAGIPFLVVGINECLKELSFRTVILVVMALCFIIAAVIFAKMLITKNYGTGIEDYFKTHSKTTVAELDRDFAEANHIVKSLWIGNKCTYHVGHLYPYILENSDLVWIYLTRISGKGDGWSVNFCDKNKKMTAITIKSGKKAKDIQEIYQNKFSHIVYGFSEQLEEMYNNDLENFLNLKYNENISAIS